MNIIISLTTVPNRLLEHHGTCPARSAITTLLEQKYSPYEVHFNVPNEYHGQTIELPSWISDYEIKYPHLKVFRTNDYGSITKLIPTLERTTDPETMIILADDDLFYMDGIISSHLEGRKKYPECVLGFAGLSALDGSCHFCTTLPTDTRVKILEGYKTVSYLRKFFDIEELKNNFLGKSWRDDETLSAYMGYKNIRKIVLAYSGDTDYTPRVESFPVIGHVPAEPGGCVKFRNCEESQKKSEENILMFYKIGYLER
jgi:hypothetical protein